MKNYFLASATLCFVVILFACNKDKATSNSTNGDSVVLDLPVENARYLNDSANGRINARATLGRVLFYDSHLSVNDAISCASCHKQAAAFADNVALSRGFENRLTGRNSPAIQNLRSTSGIADELPNLLGGATLFWDGREGSLINMVAKPIANHIEMGISDPSVLPAKLAQLPYYKGMFAAAYGSDEITLQRISEAVAYFMASIRSDSTRFDLYNRGKINLTALELQGMNLFLTKYECTNCHRISPGGYINSGFKDIGLDENYTDLGRGALSIASGGQFDGTFKTPNLRNVALTAPYMHDGRFKTLEEVLDHYSKGINNSRNLSTDLKDLSGLPLRMNISDQEKQALIAFLNTLTDNSMVTDPKFSNPFKIQ